MAEKYKILFISKKFAPFLSNWGATATPTPYKAGYLLPLGWESELIKHGIDYEVQTKEPDPDPEPPKA